MLDTGAKARLAARACKPIPAAAWAKFGYAPNQWAYVHLHTSGVRYTTMTTCRQCGKTEALAMALHDAMTAPALRGDNKAIFNDCDLPGDDGLCSHFDPVTPDKRSHNGELLYAEPNSVGLVSFDLFHVAIPLARYIFKLKQALGEAAFKLNKNEKSLTLLATGATLQWFSAENPLSVQGPTFTWLLFDEAQNIPDEVWENVRPALDVRMASVLVVGTPDPIPQCTWFRGLFLRGEDGDSPEHYSYTLPCWENRWATVETIASARDDMSEGEFRKKYLGQWVDDENAVFKNIDANFTGHFYDDPDSVVAAEDGLRGPYVIGLDVARTADYTVAYVVETKTQRVVSRFRMNHISFERAADAVEQLYRLWHVQGVHMDATAMGWGLYEMLVKRGLTVWAAQFSEEFKGKLVATIVRELERGDTILPAEDRNLRRELKAYTRAVTKAGNIRFTAPNNYNDDCVMALGLALMKTHKIGKLTGKSYING